MAKPEGKLAIVGPGGSLGRPLVAEATKLYGVPPLVLSRKPGNYGGKPVDVDLADPDSFEAACHRLRQEGVDSIVFGARYRGDVNVKEELSSQLVHHGEVGHVAIARLVAALPGVPTDRITVISGDFGIVPSKEHPALSAELAARQSLAAALGMRQAVIKGAVTRSNSADIARGVLAVHTSGGYPKQGFITIQGA